MAWSILGKRSKPYTAYSGGFKIARPAGAVKGCLLVACVNLHESPPAITGSNFTQRQNSANALDRWVIYEKEDDGSQEFEVTWSGSHPAQGFVFAISAGAGKKAAFDVSSIRESIGAKTIATTSITVAEGAELLMNLSVEGLGEEMVPPTGFTEITDEGTEETHAMHVGWQEHAAGATGEQNFKEGASVVTGFGVLIAWKAVAANVAIPLAGASGVGGGSVSLRAKTLIPLNGAGGSGGGSLALTVPTKIPLNGSSGVGGAAVTVTTPGVPVPLNGASGVGGAALKLTAPTKIPLNGSGGVGGASLALTTPTRIPLAPSSGVAGGALTIKVPFRVPLAPASGIGGGALRLTAPTKVPLTGSAGVGGGKLKVHVPIPPSFKIKRGGVWYEL